MPKTSIFKSWPFYHIIFWLITISQFAIDIIEYAPYDFAGYMLSILIRSLFIATLMYSHQFIYIPYLLQRKKFALYTFSVLASLILFTKYSRGLYFIKTNEVTEVTIPNAYAFLLKSFMGVRFLILSGLFAVLQSWFEQEKKLSQIKIDKLATELNYLRAQINPHFLFNTLNNLYGLALKKSEKVPELIMRLSDIMDYMLYESNSIKVPLKKELDHLINYLELEKIRQATAGRIEYEINGDTSYQNIVPLILLPLVENGVKHGINKMPHHGSMTVVIEVKNNNLRLEVVNAVPIPPSNEAGHGIGLQNLQSRLDSFYEGKYNLISSSEKGVYKVNLKLELS